jgi:hypothetical protein
MDPLVLLQITSLHARTLGSLKLTIGGKVTEAGPIVASLDPSAGPPANLAMLDLSTRMITLRWCVMAGLPALADMFAGLPADRSDAVCVTFEETGQVNEDGSGFDAYGGGEVAPGSFLSDAELEFQSNFITFGGRRPSFKAFSRSVLGGTPVRCVMRPESFLDFALPSALGGGTHRVNITGGFVLEPAMHLPRTMKGVRKRR